MTKRRFVLASGNRGKVRELRDLVEEAGLALEIVPQADFGVAPPEETGATFLENALAKARHAARATGLPCIADDSGLVVAALDGAPGVRSARYAGQQADDAANVAKLLAALGDRPPAARTAVFHCVLVALEDPADPAPIVATGTWLGEIATAPAGAGGFGYDPVFYLPELGRTAAQLDASQKNRISHRGQALRALIRWLRDER